MKKTTLQFLFVFFTFINLVNSQIISGMYNVSVNNSPIENCATIALGNNPTVTVSFTLRVTKPSSSTDVGSTAQFKIFLKKNSSATPVELNGILVNNSAFSGGTTWEGTFSQTISASSIEVTGSNFYGEYSHSSGNSPAKTCIYKITKNPSPTFEISPTSQFIYCDSNSHYIFTVNNVYNSPGTLSYTWYVGYGWSRNGIPVPGGTGFTTTENYIDLKPTDYTTVPSPVQVVPILNGVSQPHKTCSTARSGFSPTLLTIAGSPAICYQSASEVYDIPNLYNGLTVNWSSSNNSVATVTNSGNQAIVVPVSKGAFTLTGLVSNSCGQSFAITKNISIVGSPVANFTGEKVERYVYNYRGQDLYNDFSTYTWEYVSSTGYVDFFSVGGLAIFTAYPPFSVTMKLTATNACGSDVIYTSQAINSEDEEINRVAGPDIKITNENTINSSNFEIYPNPSNNIVNIKLKNTNSKARINSEIHARLYDLNGTQKREIKIKDEGSSINVQGLEKGIYILKINNNGKEESNKILIN
ncbi:T9SS C-terminal target domain-containing protein [Flavobacterium circumlabens]|uniref:Secreted protein (Por secretion system target) n=1 Tax=Flavobacterium circumlabens TaxID=2133765 RepID=A0A4Y7UEH9_9FLAO|nr:T9SS type A sorting domain-containing protein [Flavobacterium circumlabens]TCN59460.1 putative secreted protein (Por secretion system target) [Flavobacterium circumlabens]TEB44764.1 T9SS C-terminal target domain-containing protein [Flavobacterium circumlabens]